jgi:hypothetical protein
MGFVLLEDTYFWLKTKGLNDMGIFWLISLTKVIDLTISQIEHLDKLNFEIPHSQID